MDHNDSYKDGVYVGMENQKLLVPTGWIPDSDYVVKDRDWFKKYFENRKFFLVDTTQNKIVAINDTKLINTEYGTKNKNQLIRDIAQNMNLNTDSIENIKSDNINYSVAIDSINNTPWKIIGYVSHEEALGSLNGLERKLNILFFVAVLVLIMLIERVIYYLLKPIKQLNNTIDQITHGDFTGNIHVRGQDEIATMGRRMQKFIETMRGTIKEVVQMSQNIDTQSTAMVDLNQTVEELAKAVSEEILATSDNLANQANKVTENSYVVEKDASDLAITADLLSKQMKLFRVE